jgi:hypothetical protein
LWDESNYDLLCAQFLLQFFRQEFSPLLGEDIVV